MVLEVILLTVAIGAAILAAKLAPKPGSPVVQDESPTQSERGAFTKLLIGRREVNPVHAWRGDRVIKKEDIGGGKGGGKGPGKAKVFYEAGLHWLPVGPGWALHKIRQNGKVIFSGPITRTSHPSGSLVDIGKEGSFYIWWGEEDQDVDPFLSDPLRNPPFSIDGSTIKSRYPYCPKIVWREKRLGLQATWPILKYEWESRVQDTDLVKSPDWFDEGLSLGAGYNIVSAVDGPPSYIVINGDHTAQFIPGGLARIVNNGPIDGDYVVQDSTVSDPGTGLITTITFQQDFVGGVNGTGSIQPYLGDGTDGANPVHAIRQILCRPFPHGCGFSTALFNTESFEAAGQLMASEHLAASILAADGEEAVATLGNILTDIGFMISWDMSDGLWHLRPLRKPTNPPVISADLIVDPLPEIETSHDDHQTDRVIYGFRDRNRNYRGHGVPIDDDGQAAFSRTWRRKQVPLSIPIDFTTAQKIAERRSQEELSQGIRYQIQASRAARKLFPGQAAVFENIPQVVRVVQVGIDTLSGKTRIDAIVDSYGVDASTFVQDDGGGDPPPHDPGGPDPGGVIVEPPYHEGLGAGRGPFILIPRVRSSLKVAFADIYISADNSAYTHVARDPFIHAGGVLTEPLLATSLSQLETGPAFTPLGPDLLSVVKDYSGDLTSWTVGRQLLFIGDEILYLRNVVAAGGGTYQLRGLIRGRLGTPKATYAIGTKFFIVPKSDIQIIQDPLIRPGQTIYVKVQPATSESWPLSQIAPLVKTLAGRWIAPPDPENLRTANLRNSWIAGQNLVVDWSYRTDCTARTGAGMQGAGQAVTAKPPIEGGVFVLVFSKLGGGSTTKTASAPPFTYTAAQLTSDFGSIVDGTTITCVLKNVANGYSSATRSAVFKAYT